jgi:hypothetical protein
MYVPEYSISPTPVCSYMCRALFLSRIPTVLSDISMVLFSPSQEYDSVLTQLKQSPLPSTISPDRNSPTIQTFATIIYIYIYNF